MKVSFKVFFHLQQTSSQYSSVQYWRNYREVYLAVNIWVLTVDLSFKHSIKLKALNLADGLISLIFCVREPTSSQVPLSDGCMALDDQCLPAWWGNRLPLLCRSFSTGQRVCTEHTGTEQKSSQAHNPVTLRRWWLLLFKLSLLWSLLQHQGQTQQSSICWTSGYIVNEAVTTPLKC